MQIFSRTAVEPNALHWHPLFCPAYVLLQALRAGKPYDKWKKRATPGIHLGFSPPHARSVALVLNPLTPLTGYVSPRFHVVFDPTIGTVSGADNNPLSRCLWQVKCGLTRASASRYTHTHKNEPPPPRSLVRACHQWEVERTT
jgi:hypothetical protein